MKVLMTGMASSHCAIGKNVTFFSTLHAAISEFAEVTISEPRLSWTRADLKNFDAVILGITPPTALSANNIYGALHVLDLMYESPKLRLVVDSPQVWQFHNSIESFKRNPSQIFNDLYSSRKNYKIAKEEKLAVVESVADKISTLPWPKAYVPTLPWKTAKDLSTALRFLPEDKIFPLNLDSYLLVTPDDSSFVRNNWCVDNLKNKWWVKLSETIRYEGIPMSGGSKTLDSEVLERIKKSMGAIVVPQERIASTWWSYRYIQALNTSTPVATYWEDCQSFHPSWSKLAYQIEDMHPQERGQLAQEQYRIYSEAVPDRATVTRVLREDLESATKERM